MKIVIYILFLFITIATQAQVITGKIIDKHNSPIELAVIVLQTDDSTYMDVAYSDSLGVFTIKTDVTPFLLTIQHLMYET